MKYSPQHVDTSVGHVCMFGDKKHSAQTAFVGDDRSTSFAELYAQVCHVAYLLRHLGVAPCQRAYLDCEEEHAAMVGLLGALRGGLSVTVPARLALIETRDATIAAHDCAVVLSARPKSLGGSGKILIPLDILPKLALPKELDWMLPRPLPEDIAVRVPSNEPGGWLEISHSKLVARLRDPSEPVIENLPLYWPLVRLARQRSLHPLDLPFDSEIRSKPRTAARFRQVPIP
jgi:hypothetical protein